MLVHFTELQNLSQKLRRERTYLNYFKGQNNFSKQVSQVKIKMFAGYFSEPSRNIIVVGGGIFSLQTSSIGIQEESHVILSYRRSVCKRTVMFSLKLSPMVLISFYRTTTLKKDCIYLVSISQHITQLFKKTLAISPPEKHH